VFVERFGGGAPTEGLAGSGVEGVGDGCDILGAPTGKVGALRKVLTQKAFGVFVGAALPRALRISEYTLTPEAIENWA
jgi:hypothetical protein